jgi:hypothetical protein
VVRDPPIRPVADAPLYALVEEKDVQRKGKVRRPEEWAQRRRLERRRVVKSGQIHNERAHQHGDDGACSAAGTSEEQSSRAAMHATHAGAPKTATTLEKRPCLKIDSTRVRQFQMCLRRSKSLEA